MPNIKNQIKRDRTNKAANLKNSAAKSEARTEAISLLDKLAREGIIAHNNATRKKAHLQHIVAAL